MKLFHFNFSHWFKLTTKDLQEVLTFAVTKKTVEELEEEQAVIQGHLESMERFAPLTNVAAGDRVRNLRIQNGLVAGAILSKKFDK